MSGCLDGIRNCWASMFGGGSEREPLVAVDRHVAIPTGLTRAVIQLEHSSGVNTLEIIKVFGMFNAFLSKHSFDSLGENQQGIIRGYLATLEQKAGENLCQAELAQARGLVLKDASSLKFNGQK